MSQRDCGCGLVTPTLDELLAVAQQKPLPRVRVRERRAPPARVGATMKGWLEWRLIDRRGREVRGGEAPNLILDQGLDQIATTILKDQLQNAVTLVTYFPLIRYAAVGTDSTAPDPSQTGLGAEIARTDVTFANDEFTRPSPGVYRLTRFIEFDYSIANGNLTEWGFSSSSSSGSNLFNRALFTDGGGSPDAITKTDQEKLRLSYTLEVTLSPITLTPASFTVDNVGVVNGQYALIGGPAPASGASRCGAPDLLAFSALARGALSVFVYSPLRPEVGTLLAHEANDYATVLYEDEVSVANTSDALRIARMLEEERDAYVPGSFQRTGGVWKFDTAQGNFDPIRSFLITGASEGFGSGQSCQRQGYVFSVDVGDRFAKDDEHTLSVGAPSVSWGRA